jgi:hypothetical protein
MNGQRLHDETGMWGLFDETKRPTAFSINPDQFDEFLKHREKVDNELQDYVQRLQLPLLDLHYEDLLHSEAAFLRRIVAFLGVPDRPVKGQTLKITSDDLRKVVLNFNEVRANYVGTPYEPMFDEVLVP